ncbi:putative copper chaperone CsoZ [Staphylococcus gallinarum]|uniref:putative copper chaperone CsoZ n=1 Tax=Staphylococcus gallinarum TaxID=1293 RepID=UPI000D1CE79A|nr:hypothetical protein [Staphylococcus gallinarum]MBU7218025.1 heavy-metal-associated domain-containing protein [Staphylococcus gallinarum]MCD8794446.1 heavy-metal-associated domain-containing protein [Staphylococcus gallinarum]PTE36052.1 hypothetical protein BUZ00_06380 [Staphylococcus gallinarum]PTK91740.1 hypothetical protein BUZ03_04780 [Staphylococcus gallinarum]RIL24536.1 heavy-metal-associated domain-containing protein [Staphylococcus gallinarum]
MQTKTIQVSELNDQTKLELLNQTLTEIDGVKSVQMDTDDHVITIKFETPASLNNLEKAVYDLGYTVL